VLDEDKKPHKQEEVEQTAAIWDTLEAKGRVHEIDLDDPEIINDFEQHRLANSTNG